MSNEFKDKNRSCITDRASRRNAGFTLLELILVLAIVVLILGSATVFFVKRLPSINFNASVRDMLSTMRQARSLAQLKGTSQTVTIDLDSRRFGIEGYAAKEIPEGIDVKVLNPLSGEVYRGKYRVVFQETGAAESMIIRLSDTKREVVMEMDPIVGLMVVK